MFISFFFLFFFFQAEDGIRDLTATGVQTCALPISIDEDLGRFEPLDLRGRPFDVRQYLGKVVIVEFWATWCGICRVTMQQTRSEERRVGKECRSRWSAYH